MNIHTITTANRYNMLHRIKQLEKDLLAVNKCKKVEFDLDGFQDNMNQIIIFPFYRISTSDPNYFEKRTKFMLDIIDVCISHKLIRTQDPIKDYGSYLYMVFEGLNGAWRTPVPTDQLPPICFSVLPDTGDLIKIVRGMNGYYTMSVQLKTKELNQRKANKLNADLGVTKRQVAAMSYGSKFGWHTPGAIPNNYTVSGSPVLITTNT